MRNSHLSATLLALVALSLSLAGTAAADHPDAESRHSVHATAEAVQPLLPGMNVPAFEVRRADGSAWSVKPTELHKPAIFTFFRGGWCPYCNLHLSELRKAEAELKEMGFDLLFLSPDRPEILYSSLEDPDIGYTVLSDAELHAMRAFGIAFRLDDERHAKYLEYGINLEEVSGQSHRALPAPSTFIVGTDGRVHFQYTNPDYSVRLHPEVLMAAARSYLQDQDNSRLRRAYDAREKAED